MAGRTSWSTASSAASAERPVTMCRRGAPTPRDWSKHYWSDRAEVHVHVRELGRPNQRYALLFRDYLRADRRAPPSRTERSSAALAAAAHDDWDHYYAVKDPACDLIMAAAEEWARRTDWTRATRTPSGTAGRPAR